MITLETFLQKILTSITCTQPSVTTSLCQASGKVLAEDIYSQYDLPRFHRSTMDGYCIASAKYSSWTIDGTIFAGDPKPPPLSEKSALKILTGAPVPDNTYAVIPIEDTQVIGTTLEIHSLPVMGQWIQKKGQDQRKDSLLVAKGTYLTPPLIGLISASGISHIQTYSPLRVSILSTGNELVQPGEPILEHQIYDSNHSMLATLCSNFHFTIDPHYHLIADSWHDTCTQLQDISQQSDIVLLSGGVSMGESDFVRKAIESLGELHQWKLAMKPGKPVAIGSIQSTLILGLPGNPASVWASFLLVARPLLAKKQGITQPTVTHLQAIACFDKKGGTRQEYIRGLLDKDGAHLYHDQGSGLLSSCAYSNCFIIQPISQDIQQGCSVTVIMFHELMYHLS